MKPAIKFIIGLACLVVLVYLLWAVFNVANTKGVML